MRTVLQRVSRASVRVGDEVVGAISGGWLVLLGVGHGDSLEDVRYLADKILNLRGFADDDGKMNRSVSDCGGEVLVVSQFTLYGDCSKGRRPSFVGAAPPQVANDLYTAFCEVLRQSGVNVKTGQFQASMQVELVNDGPVTFLLESSRGQKADASQPPDETHR